MSFPSITEHERRLRGFHCVVSETTPVTLHHCHGGSMLSRWPNPGMGQRQSPALQIPLHAKYHVGNFGIDVIGVMEWEIKFGTQVGFIDLVGLWLGYNLWEYAKWLDSKTSG